MGTGTSGIHAIKGVDVGLMVLYGKVGSCTSTYTQHNSAWTTDTSASSQPYDSLRLVSEPNSYE